MPEPTIGRMIYGAYWRLPASGAESWDAAQLLYKALLDGGKASVAEDDLDLSDYIDTLAQHYEAKVTYVDKTFTVYFGVDLADISTDENKFDEMALLRVMDLDKGVLREDVKEDVKRLIEVIPYSLREKFSRPQFAIVWGTT